MEELPTERAATVLDTLREADQTLATAESHTGGRIASTFVAVPGASDVYREGIVAYVYGTKMQALGVSREILDEHGAVSPETAKAMARGVRDTAAATWGVATTGIAGPTGGTEEKPVGTSYIGIAYAGPWGSGNSYARTEHHVFDGDRQTVIDRATVAAVDLLEGEITSVLES